MSQSVAATENDVKHYELQFGVMTGALPQSPEKALRPLAHGLPKNRGRTTHTRNMMDAASPPRLSVFPNFIVPAT